MIILVHLISLLSDVKMTSKIMQEEIFGPILPVIKVSSTDEMIRTIHTLEKPLSMYIFSKDNEMIDRYVLWFLFGKYFELSLSNCFHS